jgi:predicted dehydrogenase
VKRSANKISRRTFIAGAAATAWTAQSRRRVAHANETLRIGIVLGDTPQARAALDRFGASAKDGVSARLAAAAAIDGDTPLPRGWGLKPYDRWQDVAASPEVDGVIVAAPLLYRGAVVLAALAAGKDVYVMPPMAMIVSEARAIRDAAASSNARLQVGAERCAEPAWRDAQARIATGALGPMRRSSARFQHRRGEPFLASLSDALTPLVYATQPGLPMCVVSVGGRIDGDVCKDPDMLMFTAEYPERRVLTATSCEDPLFHAALRGQRDGIEIYGEAMTPSHGLMREWLDAIVSRDTCTCNEQIGLTALAIADAALEGHVQGRPIFPVA